ncbi:MAG: ABC transporter permease [Deltaproteobacteria bacterium]|nr:ABC transporter permease [Deltaproteobacteria bacterium]
MNYLKWLIYFFSEAFQNIRGNLTTSLVTMATIAIALSLCGLFFGVFVNLNKMLDSIGSQIQITAYIKDGLSGDAVLNIRKEIADMREVENVEYVSKEKAFSIFKDDLRGEKGILEGLGANPFPASLEIKIKTMFRNPQGVKGLISKLKTMGGIEDVQYGQEWLDKFFAFIRFIEAFALIIGSFLLIAAVFIVSNTIRLVIYARREEIEILSLMGATNLFINAPFLIEGMLEGFSGAVLAVALLYLTREILILKIPFAFVSLVEAPFSPYYFVLGLITGGIVLGVFGSRISLRKGAALRG